MKNFTQLKAQLLKDPKTKKAYDKLRPEYALMEMVIKKRLERGLTQEQLARKLGTKQSAISRLESGKFNPTFSFPSKIAKALGAKLEISLS